MNKDSSEHVTRSNSAKRTSSKRRVTFDLNSSCDSSSFSPSDPSEKCTPVHNSRPKPVALATSVSKENNQRLQQKAEKLTKTSERMDSSATACFDSTLTQKATESFGKLIALIQKRMKSLQNHDIMFPVGEGGWLNRNARIH